MIDIKIIREQPEMVKKAIKDRGHDADIDTLLKKDTKWRKLQTDVQKIKGS